MVTEIVFFPTIMEKNYILSYLLILLVILLHFMEVMKYLQLCYRKFNKQFLNVRNYLNFSLKSEEKATATLPIPYN